MENTWVLIANAERARCFERHAADHTLTELIDFVHPHAGLAGKADGGDLTGAAGKGHAGTQFEPHTEVQDKERASFAKQLADYINEGVAAQRCNALALIVTSAMLGDLRLRLSSAAEKMVRRCIKSDLSHYYGLELKKRVDDALSLPD